MPSLPNRTKINLIFRGYVDPKDEQKCQNVTETKPDRRGLRELASQGQGMKNLLKVTCLGANKTHTCVHVFGGHKITSPGLAAPRETTV